VPAEGGGAFRAVDWSPWVSKPAGAGLLTDYDGTIAPVVLDRDSAVPELGAAQALSALASRLRLVGVVSGRPLAFLLRQLGGVEGLALFGLYGLEISPAAAGAERSCHVRPEAVAWEMVVARAASAAEEQVPQGVEVERKGLSFTLHVRRRPELEGWAHEWATATAARTGLRAQQGRMSVELLPPVAGKDKVIEEVAGDLGAICYAGDDRGDLPAFEVLRRLRAQGKETLCVGVSSAEEPPELAANVDVLVGGPGGLVSLLAGLADELDR
jgi:trehalose 6-phosphate phosphatase